MSIKQQHANTGSPTWQIESCLTTSYDTKLLFIEIFLNLNTGVVKEMDFHLNKT